MARAGFCDECSANVWVAEDGSCVNGHPASSVSNIYDTPPPPPLAAPVRTPLKTWVVVLLVLVAVGIPACGFFTAIAVPVFLNASARAEEKSCQANQRMIAGAAAVYRAENEDVDLPGDYESLVASVVPEYVKREPQCPSGGTYSITPEDGDLNLSCSIHGSVDR